MSAAVYFLAKSFPVLFIIPVLNTPIVNGVVVRLSMNMAEGLLWRLPSYVFSKLYQTFAGKTRPVAASPQDVRFVEITKDDDFPDFDNVDVVN